MTQRTVVTQWLQRVLAPYPSSDIVRTEVLDVIQRYPTLNPKTEAYTYDTGHTNLLVQLYGTIPITYRSATYHIPITVWFPLEYPRRAPMVYVSPTKDMGVRKSKEVEPGGRVGGEVLEGWERKWQAQSIVNLLESLQSLFSIQPPVYSKATTSAPSPPTQTNGEQTPPPPPPPPARPRSMMGAAEGSNSLPVYSSTFHPPRPPHPPPPPPSIHRQASTSSSPPPIPPHPPNGKTSMAPIPPRQPWDAPHPPPPPPPQPRYLDLMTDLLDDDDTTKTPSRLSTPPIRPLPPSTLHLHSLLLSHITSRLPHLQAHLQSTTQQLLSIQADLTSGQPAIRDEMARLVAVRDVCGSVVERMSGVVGETEKRVMDVEGRGEVEVDQVVCGISIVHNQLIDLVAEDNAIEDTIYHLARSLDTERIDLDRFLKQIRILAREQYQKRALIERIQNMMER